MPEEATEQVRSEVMARADDMCECTMRACKHHGERCTQLLRDRRDYVVHRVSADLPFTAANARAICLRCRPNNPTLRSH